MMSLYRRDWIRRKWDRHAENAMHLAAWAFMLGAFVYFAWHVDNLLR
jgi:hypothetical protein